MTPSGSAKPSFVARVASHVASTVVTSPPSVDASKVSSVTAKPTSKGVPLNSDKVAPANEFTSRGTMAETDTHAAEAANHGSGIEAN